MAVQLAGGGDPRHRQHGFPGAGDGGWRAAVGAAVGAADLRLGAFGSAAIAGYGTAARLEYLLIPLVFGIGAPLVAMVGTCIAAGQRERTLRAALVGAALCFAMAEAIGLWAEAFPHTWLRLFSDDPAMLEAGTQ